MKDSRLCNKCGLIPQTGATPKTPCKPKCKKCKKDCCINDFVFRKVVIPVALGDDETGNDKPSNGVYTNSLVQYEANGALYLYDSGGIYTKLGEGGGEYPVESVNGKTGVVVLTTEDIENLSGYQNGEQVSLAVSTAVNAEATAREAADAELTQGIATVANGLATEVTTRQDADTALNSSITTINSKIPAQASATNPLADRSFVNSSVQTATANFRGNWDTYAQIPTDATLYPADYAGSTTPTTNDYLVVQDASDTPVGTGEDPLTGTWRFKYSGEWATDGKSGWHPEYQVNETPLTSDQLAALNSGITATAVTQIGTNASDIADLQTDVAGKQDTLTAGQNVTIDPSTNTISATDTTYSDFTGTDGTTAGTAGLVPAPATTDAGKFLKADGTWDNAGGGTLYTTIGNNTDGAMTQKATTEMIYADASQLTNIVIGNTASSPLTAFNLTAGQRNIGSVPTGSPFYMALGHQNTATPSSTTSALLVGNRFNNGSPGCRNTVAFGGISTATGAMSLADYSAHVGFDGQRQGRRSFSLGYGNTVGNDSGALGYQASSVYSHSVAIGGYSTTSRASEVSVGDGSSNADYGTRYLANVRDPQNAQDAATKNYVDMFYPVGTVYTSTSATAPTFVGGTWTDIGTQTIGSSTVHYYERTA